MARGDRDRRIPSDGHAGLPDAAQLAAVGIALCFRRRQDGELGGWRQAASVRSCSDVDSEGIRESLCFDDADGRCCWRMYLLPDSDFLAWERLAAALPSRLDHDGDTGIGARLWHRLAGRLHCGQWRASALRLHALPPVHRDGGPPRLGASVVSLSALGAAVARRIVRAEGAECGALVEVDGFAAARFPRPRRHPTTASLRIHAGTCP